MTEAEAYEFMEALWWDGEPVCPHCGTIGGHYFLKPRGGVRKTRTGNISHRRVWKCRYRDCRKQFSVLTGTPLQGTQIALSIWVQMIKDGRTASLSCRQIEREYGISLRTAWLARKRLRTCA